MEIPYAADIETTYENFEASCPHCRSWNVFNRRQDLGTFEPISFRTVRCHNRDCQQPFNINGDLVATLYETLIFDACRLREEKRYCACISSLAQACEAFASHFLRVELVLRPFARHLAEGGSKDIDEVNCMHDNFCKVLKSFTFVPLRSIFIQWVLNHSSVLPWDAVAYEINAIGATKRKGNVSRRDICTYPDARIRDLLLRFSVTTIHEVRNKVVHQFGYRPSLAEVEGQLKDVREVVFGLGTLLKVNTDDPNFYLREARENP